MEAEKLLFENFDYVKAYNEKSQRAFLESNGFIRKKENDYYHPNLCIILEDLHEENVLTKEGTLQFVDTVFYLMPDFYLD